MKQLIFTLIILFIVVTFLIVFLPPKKVTLKDLQQSATPLKNQKELATQESTYIDTPKTLSDNKVQVAYYIIVGSFKNITLAQQEAEKFNKDFNTNIIILPPTTDGYYRISYGKYSRLEEAKDTIKSLKSEINSQIWIYSEKK